MSIIMTDIDPSLVPQPQLSPEGRQFLDALHHGMGFRIVEPNDCSPDIYSNAFRQEVASGVWSSEEQTQLALKTMGAAGLVLRGRMEAGPKEIPLIEKLAKEEPVFVVVDESMLSDDMQVAGSNFGADDVGIILKTEVVNSPYGSKILAFPGITKGNREYRVLQTQKRDTDHELAVRRALSLLSLGAGVHEQNGSLQGLVEFVEDADRPTHITQTELSMWLRAVRGAGVGFDLDVSTDDDSLDNFLRIDRRLVWVDGNIMRARLLEQSQIDAEVEKHKRILSHFVR